MRIVTFLPVRVELDSAELVSVRGHVAELLRPKHDYNTGTGLAQSLSQQSPQTLPH